MNKLTELSKFDQIYQRQVTETPIFNCSLCERTFFKRDICFVKQEIQAKQNKIRKLSTSFENVKSRVENCYICKHCKKAIEHETIAKYAVPEQIRRNNATRTLTQLTELEERLVALRLPFLQIKEIGHRHKKLQLGLTGGVINVPTNISRIQSALPRTIKDTDTVAVVLKKSLRFKSAYAFGRVRVHKVMEALKQLCKRMLYKLETATINDNWKDAFLQNQEAYQSSSEAKDSEHDNQDNDEPMKKTLVHGFIDAHTVHDLVNKQINIALATIYMPLGIFKDKYSEEMSFC